MQDNPFTHSVLGPLGNHNSPYLACKPRVPNWWFIFVGSSGIRPETPAAAPEITGSHTAKKSSQTAQVRWKLNLPLSGCIPEIPRIYPHWWHNTMLQLHVQPHRLALEKNQSIFKKLWASSNSQNTDERSWNSSCYSMLPSCNKVILRCLYSFRL